jgi:hypothetical protein
LDPTRPSPDPRAPGRSRGVAFPLAALLALAVVSALAATGLARWLRAPEVPVAPAKPGKFPDSVLGGWKKPDLVLVLTGQQHGYLLPCGCSEPQVGGLERRYNLVKVLRDRGWHVLGIDLGDVPQRTGPADLPNQQGMIKYVCSMRALNRMGYTAVGFGEHEVNLGLSRLLANFGLNEAPPDTVSTNLMDADRNFPQMVLPWKPQDVKGTGLRLGVVSVTGPLLAARIKKQAHGDKALRFAQTKGTLDNVLPQLRASKVDLPVLLYQGPLSRNQMKRPPTEGLACAEAYPEFPIVLCHSDEDEPPLRPYEVTRKGGGKTLLLTPGHKGKFVCVVGVWKTGKPAEPFAFRYERVEMTEDFATPKGKEKDHPILELMESYTRQLRDDRYLEKYGGMKHPLQVMPEVKDLKNSGPVKYAGTHACKRCHDHAYDVWKKSAHSHAYKTLVEGKPGKPNRPTNRQYDPECIVCHTVGFGYESGYVNEAKTPKLQDVGCESCHGPGRLHVRNPRNKVWQMRINPWKYLPANQRKFAMDQMCQKCHDPENDVHWTHKGFERKWPQVEHPTPKEEKAGDE